MAELLCCPFCGGAASKSGGLGDTWFAYCANKCQVQPLTDCSPTEAEAIARWNTRAQPDATAALRRVVLTKWRWYKGARESSGYPEEARVAWKEVQDALDALDAAERTEVNPDSPKSPEPST